MLIDQNHILKLSLPEFPSFYYHYTSLALIRFAHLLVKGRILPVMIKIGFVSFVSLSE